MSQRKLSKLLKSVEKEVVDFLGDACYTGSIESEKVMNKKISKKEAAKMMKATAGRIFSVTFEKKDGSMRDMVCRTGVTKHLKGGELAYEPKEYDLMGVFDVQKGGYRMINLDTVKRISVNGKEFKVN